MCDKSELMCDKSTGEAKQGLVDPRQPFSGGIGRDSQRLEDSGKPYPSGAVESKRWDSHEVIRHQINRLRSQALNLEALDRALPKTLPIEADLLLCAMLEQKFAHS